MYYYCGRESKAWRKLPESKQNSISSRVCAYKEHHKEKRFYTTRITPCVGGKARVCMHRSIKGEKASHHNCTAARRNRMINTMLYMNAYVYFLYFNPFSCYYSFYNIIKAPARIHSYYVSIAVLLYTPFYSVTLVRLEQSEIIVFQQRKWEYYSCTIYSYTYHLYMVYLR